MFELFNLVRHNVSTFKLTTPMGVLMSRLSAQVLSLLVLAATYTCVPAPAFCQGGAEPYARARANNNETYLKLRNIKVGPEVIKVDHFTLKKDAATFNFNSGAFYLLEPVNGKTTGAVFLGEATFSLQPPIKVEQRNLAILTKGAPFEEHFGGAVFRFTDGTEAELRKAAAPAAAAPGGDPGSLLGDIQSQLKKKLKENLSARLLEDVLSSEPGGKFTAFIKGKKYSDKMIFDIDPNGGEFVAPEEVHLLLWDETKGGIWAAFHLASEYASHTANSDEQNLTVAVTHQKLDVSIAKNANLTGTARTTVVALKSGVRVVPLELFHTLRVESVISKQGESLSFVQEDKNEDADFAVILPRELQKGEEYEFTTKYEGKDAISNEGRGELLSHRPRRLVSQPGLKHLRHV
jgi:hypothetical protein